MDSLRPPTDCPSAMTESYGRLTKVYRALVTACDERKIALQHALDHAMFVRSCEQLTMALNVGD